MAASQRQPRAPRPFFGRFHYNPLGLFQRDAVSCRMEHEASVHAHFAPGFDADGNLISRTGYMVPCEKDSDCISKCPTHPLTGSHYRCQRNITLFDTVVTNDGEGSGGIVLAGDTRYKNLSEGTSSSFDVAAGMGVCVDAPSIYEQSCTIPIMAQVIDGLVGCMDSWATFWLCGVEVRIKHGDTSTASLEGNFGYPRTLYEGFTCHDPIDCRDKCQYLHTTSVEGRGVPPACAVCDLYCPSNIVTTIMSLVNAVFEDVLSIIRIVTICLGDFGFAGCICQLALTLQPSWRKYSTNKDVRCENGDPFGQILGQVEKAAIDGLEPPINTIIDGINVATTTIATGINDVLGTVDDALDEIPFFSIDLGRISDPSIPSLCIRTEANPNRPGVEHCGDGLTAEEAAAVTACEDDSSGKEFLCFYNRVAEICSSGSLLSDWRELFAKGYEGLDELEAEFVAAFAESYDALDPILKELLVAVEASENAGPDLEKRKDICSSESFASAMTLDQIITSCFFAMAESSCPTGGAEPDSDFEFLIESTSFEIPQVRFEWDVSPPPPPPGGLTLYQELSLADPAGFELARTTLEDLLPTLAHVATSSVGASVGSFLADYTMTQQQLTRAFLSSRQFEADSLGARWTEAQHTNVWRRTCREIVRFLTDHPEHTGVGTAGLSSAHASDTAYKGAQDRNLFLCAARPPAAPPRRRRPRAAR